MPMQFVLLLIAGVALYILADAMFDVSEKISRKVRALSLPALPALAAKSWMRLAAIPVVLVVLVGVIKYVEGRGADRVRVEIAEKNVEVIERSANARAEFERDVRQRVEDAIVREREILESLGHVDQTIRAAPDRAAIAAAHADAVSSLRHDAERRHADAVADYVSSVGG